MYELIAQEIKKNALLVATVISGQHQGEKCVLSKETILYETDKNSFFADRIQEILSYKENGIVTIDDNKVFCDHIGTEKQLVICGGGHVAMPVISMGNMLGFYTVVLEDRPVFADHARKAGANEVLCDSFKEGLDKVKDTTNTYYVIVTRGHRYDSLCLEEILHKHHAYIGMMGSMTRVGRVMNALEEKGISREQLNEVHSPIGLNIGAQTPEEIAVSIMAEIVQVKCRRRTNDSYTEDLLEGLAKVESLKERAVLVTIVSRNGSAPREIGTKMLVTEDTSVIGTIGGGCIEAAAYHKCIRMFKEDHPKNCIFTIDMSAENAMDSGMVCGGKIDVLLEKINM